MIIIAYDFTSNKRRNKFSKFLKQYGEKIQYSVYQIKNSQRLLNIIMVEIENNYVKYFENTDSILIFQICNTCIGKVKKYGSSSNQDKEVVYFD